MLINTHGTCDSRECAAKSALENGISGEMGGGTYTYLTLPGLFFGPSSFFTQLNHPTDQIRNGTVDVKFLDETVKAMLRTKFTLGLFESRCPVV